MKAHLLASPVVRLPAYSLIGSTVLSSSRDIRFLRLTEMVTRDSKTQGSCPSNTAWLQEVGALSSVLFLPEDRSLHAQSSSPAVWPGAVASSKDRGFN